MRIKQLKRQGNDCIIYETIIAYPVGYKAWVVSISKQFSGSWCDNSVTTDNKPFDSQEEAEGFFEYYVSHVDSIS